MTIPIDNGGDPRFPFNGPIDVKPVSQPSPASGSLEIKVDPAPEITFVKNYLRQVTEGDVLTNIEPENVVASSDFNHGLIMSSQGAERWLALCCPSPEAIKDNQPSQDKMGVIQLDEARLLILQADGVGTSYYGDNAAGFAVRETGQNGTINLQGNLERIGEIFKNWGPGNLPVADQSPLKIIADEGMRKDVGSHTTFNQYLLNHETGVFRAHLLGDGYYAIVRANGVVEKMPVGHHKNRLTTRSGIEGDQAVVGGKLDDGDTIFIYSDGMDGLTDNQLTEASNAVKKGDDGEVKSVLEKQVLSLTRDDDRSLFVYRHRTKQVA